MTAPVSIDAVAHSYGGQAALGGVTLDIDAGEYVVLLGPSGCGKTTLLSVLGGFVTPDAGRVRVGGQDVTALPPARRPTTTMFQDYALFPHMTCRDNVAFGLRMRGTGRAERHRRAGEMLALVGMETAAGKRPHQLSGGQRQRVALARALAVAPDVLLLDEPLGALDLALRRAMQDELKALQRRLGTTFVHVTHDQEEAMAIADRIVVMNAGRIEDAGPPDRVYRRPASLFAATFMGETNLIPARGEGGRIATPLGTLDVPGAPAQGDLVLCLRPQALRAGAEGWPLGEARITDAAFFGTHYRVALAAAAAPDLRLTAHLPPDTRPRPGETLALSADPGAIAVFPAPET